MAAFLLSQEGNGGEMAETAVCSVIDRLISLLTEEVQLLRFVHKEVEDVKEELESIQSFLKDADRRAEKEDTDNSGLKTWVKQVRDTAYRIEDVVDEYLLHLSRNKPGFASFLKKTACLVGGLKPRYKIASEIQDIKSLIRDVKERSGRYGLSSSDQALPSAKKLTWHNPRVASLFLEEDEVVGLEATKNEMIGWLVEGGYSSRRSVVSFAGMGGLGKTTLAKVVYDSDEVTQHFECKAWCAVSQSYKKEELLRFVIMQFCHARKETAPDGIGAMDEISLIAKLREYLQQKRYFVVFDDVWKIDFWGDIEHALLDNNIGSRILITTRINDVASFCKKSSRVLVHELQPLSPRYAWELFCKKAFQLDSGGHCPSELKALSLAVVEKCKGLPLAIVTIGGLLSTKDKVVSEWKNLHDSLGSELSSNPHLTDVSKILSLSYLDLPYHLKPCFLYFGLFPEDYSISRPRLFAHWIAEGFVKKRSGKISEQVAEEYLTELVNRNLVEVHWGQFNGVNKRCRIHDMMREIILSRTADLRFCHVLEENDTSFDRKARRVSFYGIGSKAGKVLVDTVENSRVRSVLVFKADEKISKSFMVKMFESFRLLKLLDFEDAALDFLPEEVGSLFHLRYLSVSNTKVKRLPRSIGKLCNLETLNVTGTLVQEIPAEVNKLCKLRNLLAKYINVDTKLCSSLGVRIHQGVRCLERLRTLLSVDANQGVDIVKELENLRELHVLGIYNLTKQDGKALSASIDKMTHLASLEVISGNGGDDILDLHSISSPPQLKDLLLRGRLEKLPSWIMKLEHLVTIGLFGSRLGSDPLRALQVLPNLTNVYLCEDYHGEELHIEAGGFRRLKLLSLRKLHGLTSLVIDKGSAPVLEELQIGPSPLLKEAPSGIPHLRDLKTLVFYDMPREFVLRMVSEGEGRDYWKVEHIPTVLFSYRTSEDQHETFKLGDPNLLKHLQDGHRGNSMSVPQVYAIP